MWLLTPMGFFSIVEKAGDRAAGTLTVRARVRSDLDALRQHYLPELGDILANRGTDYRYRAQAPRAAIASAMARLAETLHYDNFKNAVAHEQGSARAHLYHEVWDVLYRLNSLDATAPARPAKPSAPKASSYGGVLINAEGLVLLREPANHYDNYLWTFAKGKPNKGDRPEDTALREVLEETGYHAEILTALPEAYAGGTGSTGYFLMRPVGEPGQPDAETQAIRWVSFDEAADLIGQTTNRVGRARDLRVLADARVAYAALIPGSSSELGA